MITKNSISSLKRRYNFKKLEITNSNNGKMIPLNEDDVEETKLEKKDEIKSTTNGKKLKSLLNFNVNNLSDNSLKRDNIIEKAESNKDKFTFNAEDMLIYEFSNSSIREFDSNISTQEFNGKKRKYDGSSELYANISQNESCKNDVKESKQCGKTL